MHFRDSWDHFCDFLGVFLGAYFWGLSEEAPGACERHPETSRARESDFLHAPGRDLGRGNPSLKGL